MSRQDRVQAAGAIAQIDPGIAAMMRAGVLRTGFRPNPQFRSAFEEALATECGTGSGRSAAVIRIGARGRRKGSPC